MSFNKILFIATHKHEEGSYNDSFLVIQPDSDSLQTQRPQDFANQAIPGRVPADHQQPNQQFLPILPGIQDEIERQVIPADHQQANQV